MKSISIGGPLQLARKFVDIPWQRHQHLKPTHAFRQFLTSVLGQCGELRLLEDFWGNVVSLT